MSMMKAIRYLLNLLILLLCFYAFSQDVNYTIKEGLPSNTVYCIEQDDQGFIWFGTAAGLSRYDGYEFINYGLADGLPDMDILKFFKDSKGRIWLYTNNGKVGFIQNGKIYSSQNSLYLTEIEFDSRIGSISEFDGDIIFSSNVNGVKVLHEDGSLDKYDGAAGWYHHAQSITDNWYWFLQDSMQSLIRRGTSESDFIELTPNSLVDIEFTKRAWPVRYTVGKGDMIIGSTLSKQYQCIFILNLETNKLDYLPISDYEVYNIKKVDDQILLMTNEGIKKFDEERFDIEDYLEIPEVTDVLIDLEGNQWISNLHSGVQLTYRTELKNRFKSEIRSSEQFLSLDSMLLMTVNESDVFAIKKENDPLSDDTKLNLARIWGIPQIGQIKGLSVTQNGKIWVLRSSGLFTNGPTPSQSYREGGRRNFLKETFFFYSKNVQLLELIDLNNGVIASFGVNDPPNIKDFIWISSNSILLINNESVQILNILGGSIEFISSFEGLGVNNVRKDQYGSLWFSTQGNGLFRLKQDSLTTYTANQMRLNQILGTSDVINDLLVDGSTLYLTTPWGLEIIKFSEFENDEPVKANLLSGLNIGRINDVSIFDSTIFIGTENGLYTLDQNIQNQTQDSEKPFIEEIRTTTGVYLPDSSVVFNHDVGQVSFTIKVIDYLNHNDLQYQYRVDAGDWFSSSLNQIVFSDLKPGTHLMQFRSKTRNSKWSESVSYTLNIAPAFWQTTWFTILAIILTVAISSLVAYRIFLFNSRKKQLQKEKLTSDLKALKAQINPHFLFNALNSIQNFVLENQETLAEDYLVKYGKLMRKILDHSNDLTINLKEELEYIQIYIDLERLRLIKKLDFEVVICDEIDINSTMVPSMIIQPLIENAIWHGIQPSDREGKIKLSFFLDKNMIYVEIEDNGVGFDSSVMKSSKKPHGVSLIKERIRLLNEIKKIDANLEFSSNDEGTVVSFFYPINLN